MLLPDTLDVDDDGDADAIKDRPKPDHAEWGLSHWVNTFLERTMIGECWYTAIESGTWLKGATAEQRMHAENRRRARGIKPAHLDWMAYQLSTGIYAQWELKVNGRPTRRGQEQTIVALRRNKIPTAICETMLEVYNFLIGAGFELHGNAANIAIQLHEQYLSKRREHATPTKPKRADRKTAPKTATVAWGHRSGVWKP